MVGPVSAHLVLIAKGSSLVVGTRFWEVVIHKGGGDYHSEEEREWKGMRSYSISLKVRLQLLAMSTKMDTAM